MEGKHEKLISKELFLKVNQERFKSALFGMKQTKENELLPLRKFITCDVCGEPFTGYVVKARGKWYYKCRTKGCRCNQSVSTLHEAFKNFLSGFMIDEKYSDLIRYQLEHIIEEGTKEERELSKLLKTRITQVQNKIDKLDERYFITGDLPEAKYKQLSTQLQEEKAAVEAELEALTVEDISNISELVNTVVSISANLAPTWVSSTFEQKLQLQKLVFPKGIVFDRQNRSFRTIAVNPAISVIAEISTSCKQKKKGQERFSSPLSLSAEREGLP